MRETDNSVVSATFKYLRQKRIRLGEAVQHTKKVYLDTKYWVLLRDVRLGRTTSKPLTSLLRTLERLAAEGHAICPFNADIFLEIIKQSDWETLTATAKLIDDLCRGVCIVHEHQRIETEILHFIESSRGSGQRIHPLNVLVWTSPSHWLGCAVPDFGELPEPVIARLQRDFADFAWDMTISEWLQLAKQDGVAALRSFFPDISSGLNNGKFANLNEHNSYKAVFMSEISGVLDAFKDRFPSLFQYLYERDTGNAATDAERTHDDSARLLKNLIYHAFRLNKLRLQMPTIRVVAALHAAIRWDTKRRYKPNDCRDIHHAAAAIPYCDVMLTEKPLAHLAQDQNLRFKELFPCRLVATPEEALTTVQQLAA